MKSTRDILQILINLIFSYFVQNIILCSVNSDDTAMF